MNRLRLRCWHFEKQVRTRGKYWNSPDIIAWSYCGSFKAKTAEEAVIDAMFKVGSSLVRVMPEFEMPEDDKGYL